MSDGVPMDRSTRLPWLDDPAPQERHRKTVAVPNFACWAVAGLLAVAGASYWLGMQSAQDGEVRSPQARTAPEARLTLPRPETGAQTEVTIPATPEVRIPEAPVVSMPGSRNSRSESASGRARLKREDPPTESLEKAVTAQSGEAEATGETAPAPQVKAPEPLTLWPARNVSGANGRLVQIGAFGSRYQAKLGWRRMQRSYPAVGRLPAVVVEARNSKGRKFYRFQIGTTSQAHSEVLCQRMERIRFSCAVLGLPWKAKVER